MQKLPSPGNDAAVVDRLLNSQLSRGFFISLLLLSLSEANSE